ncbi:MAG: sugar nucleotidyltransferase [Candidatus Altimarinota bacterium]
MKGIILAGGSGSRLYPCTKVTSKQLLPIYNKPMIYYPLETLLKAGIKEVLIIVAPEHAGDFVNLLGSGKDFGARFFYEVQDKPEGLAQAFLIGESFIDDDHVTMILGDNLFEDDLTPAIQGFQGGAQVFVKRVEDPERFGVVEIDPAGKILSIEEKPKSPKSQLAVTGVYTFDCSVIAKAKELQPSPRGELEITDLIRMYLEEGKLNCQQINGQWIDTGTFESMFEATQFVRNRELAS